MRTVFLIVIIAALALGGWRLYQYWKTFSDEEKQPQRAAVTEVEPTQLRGLPANLEPTLQASLQRGGKGLRDFLQAHGKSISDPRLAAIELDYVLLIASTDPGEARRVFARVKQRTDSKSPVYSRVKELEKTYQ